VCYYECIVYVTVPIATDKKGVCWYRKQRRNGSLVAKGNGGLRFQKDGGKVGKRHPGRVADDVVGGRSEARKSKQRYGYRLSREGQHYKTPPYWKPQVEECYHRTPAILCGLSKFGWYKPRRSGSTGTQKRFHAPIFSNPIGSVSVCGISKKLIAFNPMQYVVMRSRKEEYSLFSDGDGKDNSSPTITHEQFLKLMGFLRDRENPALLPIHIAYYTGLRIGEACALTWQDVNLDEQYLTVRRSMKYNGIRKRMEIGATKRNKIRTVDFCDTLAEILKAAKLEQKKNRFRYGELYHLNYYKSVTEKDRTYYEVYTLPVVEEKPLDYTEIPLVCLRLDGAFEAPNTISLMCRSARKKLKGLEGFHFHMLRHTFTSNLLSGGATPKEVQELLGHTDVSTTMNIYAHATREAKRSSARLLDKVVGNENE